MHALLDVEELAPEPSGYHLVRSAGSYAQGGRYWWTPPAVASSRTTQVGRLFAANVLIAKCSGSTWCERGDCGVIQRCAAAVNSSIASRVMGRGYGGGDLVWLVDERRIYGYR